VVFVDAGYKTGIFIIHHPLDGEMLTGNWSPGAIGCIRERGVDDLRSVLIWKRIAARAGIEKHKNGDPADNHDRYHRIPGL